MTEYDHYVDGEWVAGEGGEFDSENPAIAVSTSDSVPCGKVPSVSPVAGFSLVKSTPSPAIHSPSM